MLGTILFVDEVTGTGIVRADDGKRYRFPVSDWPATSPLTAGTRIDFDTEGDQAIGPLPVTDAVVQAVVAAPTPTERAFDAPPIADSPTPASPVIPAAQEDANEQTPTDPEPNAARPAISLGKPVSITKQAQTSTDHTAEIAPAIAALAGHEPAPADPVSGTADSPVMPPAEPIAARPDDPTGQPRPVAIDSEAAPDYVDQSDAELRSGGMSGLLIAGGVVLLLALAGLGYMMWDNAETAGFSADNAEEAGTEISLYAQEDLPVRNVAAMTNATVLGRITRGDRVTGVEVAGSADPQSRWLRIAGGNRFVPMTGLGPAAPPAAPAAPVVPAPTMPPRSPDGAGFDQGFGGQADGFPADPDGRLDGAPPVRPVPPPNRAAPPVRPAPPPDRASPPPQRSSPEDTRPVGPQRPAAPQRQTDPRETQPVG